MTRESCAARCGQPAIFDTGRCLQHQRPAPRADRQRDMEAGELAVTRPVPGPVMTPALLAAKADAEAHGFTVERAAALERGWLSCLLGRLFG